jgi:hypothetical protein
MNFSLPNLILGLIAFVLGGWIVYAAFDINHHILFAGWAEKKWGPGSGTTFYRFLGLAICIFAIFVMVGIIDLFGSAFSGTVSPGNSNPQTQSLTPGSGTNTRRIAD